ncbi:MAG: hypothetical protein GY856_14810 [bacterium]|nr:hypothetical protein [bacterium]
MKYRDRLRAGALLQLTMTLVGALSFCIYARSWQDLLHLLYDIPAAVATYAFLAKVVVEGIRGRRTRAWWCRALLVILMAVVVVGREFSGWKISGHLTSVLIVALIQSLDSTSGKVVRFLYWIPVPIVLVIRWLVLDHGDHVPTFAAVVVAVAAIMAVLVFDRIQRRLSRRPGDPARRSPAPEPSDRPPGDPSPGYSGKADGSRRLRESRRAGGGARKKLPFMR